MFLFHSFLIFVKVFYLRDNGCGVEMWWCAQFRTVVFGRLFCLFSEAVLVDLIENIAPLSASAETRGKGCFRLKK